MSRSGYTEDYEGDLNLYRGNVERAICGKRGRAFMKELLERLDAMPEKRLIDGELEEDGQVCTLGVMTRARGLDHSRLKFEDHDEDFVIDCLKSHLKIAGPMIREIMYMNDEAVWNNEDPEHRWRRMRAWVASYVHG